MAERAALVTGGSSGIGLAIARALGQDGYSITLSARRPEKLEDAATSLRDEGIDVSAVPANVIDDAGIGIGGPIAEQETKRLDLQLGVNLRAVYITLRECISLLKQAGAEHRKALVVNTASIAG